jgi:hypothetical protein
MVMAKTGFIRIVYLYLFALLGLVFTSIGSIRFLDMGLRAFVFKNADAMERYQPPPMPTMIGRRPGDIDSLANKAELTAEEKQLLRDAIEQYRIWQEQQQRVDPVSARRQRDASSSLAMILVGLPLYLYHWRVIKRESAERRRLAEQRRSASSV